MARPAGAGVAGRPGGSGAITITRVELADAEVHDARARTILQRRWRPDSPLRRAATAALAYLEARGVSLLAVHLQGRDIEQSDTPYFVGLGWRHIRSMPWCLAEWKGEEWLEVPRPTKTQPLLALRITVADRDALVAEAWGALKGSSLHSDASGRHRLRILL